MGRRTGLWDKNKEGSQEIRNRMKIRNGDYSCEQKEKRQ